jgi:hypothetical protein
VASCHVVVVVVVVGVEARCLWRWEEVGGYCHVDGGEMKAEDGLRDWDEIENEVVVAVVVVVVVVDDDEEEEEDEEEDEEEGEDEEEDEEQEQEQCSLQQRSDQHSSCGKLYDAEQRSQKLNDLTRRFSQSCAAARARARAQGGPMGKKTHDTRRAVS